MLLDATTSRRDAAELATRVLSEAGLDEPRREAAALLSAILDLGAADLVTDPGLEIGVRARRLAAALDRRARHEPLSRILGRRAFWTLELEITPATLDPRPETETLVEVVRDELVRRGRCQCALAILDLGTGSGAILLALLAEFPNARGLGTDVSPAALEVARRNAVRSGVGERAAFRAASWLDGIAGSFDVIVSNPPYIPSGDIAGLGMAVRGYDPPGALDGGPDGLDPYRIIIPRGARLLSPGGVMAVEIGATQAAAVDRLMDEAGLAALGPNGRVWPDLAGRPRCVAAKTY